MSAHTPAATEAANEVRLVGRISQQPTELVLPSGDTVWTFRVVVPRAAGRGRTSQGRTRQPVDALDCCVWSGRVRRSVAGWRADDVVEVTGAVRRRFFQTARGSASRVEVDVSGGKLIRRAASA